VADPVAHAVFGLLFETSQDALFILSRDDQRILSANVCLADLLAVDHASLVGRTLDELVFETGRDLSRPGQYEEVSLRRGDDYPVFVTLNVSFVDDEHHGALVACMARDTTERRLLERELFAKHSALVSAHVDLEAAYRQLRDTKLQLEDRNREIALLAWRAAVGELVAGIAHQLNNPVGALSSTIRHMGTLAAKLPAEPRGDLERLLARVAKIATRIESNVNAIVRASHSAIAGSEQRLELPHELAAVLSTFAESLDDIPTKEVP
jgi:signal transduction histidine kinase